MLLTPHVLDTAVQTCFGAVQEQQKVHSRGVEGHLPVEEGAGVTSCIVNIHGCIWPANQSPFAF